MRCLGIERICISCFPISFALPSLTGEMATCSHPFLLPISLAVQWALNNVTTEDEAQNAKVRGLEVLRWTGHDHGHRHAEECHFTVLDIAHETTTLEHFPHDLHGVRHAIKHELKPPLGVFEEQRQACRKLIQEREND